jgi:hypothetical protein
MAADNILTELPPEKLRQVLDSLEAERLRRAAANSADPVPTVVERTFADPDSNPIINAPAPAAPQKPRPRKAPKPARLTPVPFFVTMGKPNATDTAGRIEEGFFVVRDGMVFLTDANGAPSGEGHTILRDAAFTARQALRNRLAARRSGPDHGPIQYKPTGWM